MTEDQETIAALREEIALLRDGEEGGFIEGTIPTPGQLLKRIHGLGRDDRLRILDAVLQTAELGRQCGMSLHEANLSELRQKAMTSWSTLHRISELCRDHDVSIPVETINDLLPEALRRG